MPVSSEPPKGGQAMTSVDSFTLRVPSSADVATTSTAALRLTKTPPEIITNPTVVVTVPLGRSVSAYRNPATFCRANPFVASWSDASFSSAAASLTEYRSTVVHRTHELTWNKHLPNAQGAVSKEPYQSLPNAVPCGGNLYSDGDGKLVCHLETLKTKPECIIYSLGSDGNVDFENNMLKETLCDIFIFDCTLNEEKTQTVHNAVAKHQRLHFYPICLGGDDDVKSAYRSLASLMKEYGHTFIDLLQMDIEGYEFRVVEALFSGWLKGDAALPSQISMEQHYLTQPGLAWGGHVPGLSAGDMAILWINLAEMGYVIVAAEPQSACSYCIEISAVRAFC